MKPTVNTFDEFMEKLYEATHKVNRDNVAEYIGVEITNDIYVSMNKDMCIPDCVGWVNLTIKRQYTQQSRFPLRLALSPVNAWEIIARITQKD